MKNYINIVVLFLFVFTGAGCSSFSERFDIAGVIDSTENWIFGEKDSKNNEDLKESSEGRENNELDVEEVFPDVEEVPQERPNFEELDESFFEEEETLEQIKTEESPIPIPEELKDSIEKEQELKDLSVEKKNILAVLKIRENIRLNLVKLLINSDPLVNNKVGLINNKVIPQVGNKIAIIQFPNNSIIPDKSAYKVIDQIINIGNKNNIKLIGHASRSSNNNITAKRKNMEISIARAETIKNILVNKGFAANRIFTSGKGDLEPLQKEADKYGEAINRRVEIFFISE